MLITITNIYIFYINDILQVENIVLGILHDKILDSNFVKAIP